MKINFKIFQIYYLIPFLLWAPALSGCSWDFSNSSNDYGTINLSTIPDKADIYLDKSFIGNTPMSSLRIKTGKHLLTIEKKGHVTWEKQIQIFPFNEQNVLAELEILHVDPAPPLQNPPN
jgi:hypothetical protein